MARNQHGREKRAGELKRKMGRRPPYRRVLIACEGAKTEPLYFNDIRRQNRIPSAHIHIVPADGTDPARVVDFTERKFKETREWDLVYAVFDRDDHASYARAIARATALDGRLFNDERKAVRFHAIPSVPCFELWLLLHYDDVQAFYHRAKIISYLRACIAGYEKGTPNVYAETEALLPVAVERAQRLVVRFQPLPGTDPYTRVHEVVELLRAIRAPDRLEHGRARGRRRSVVWPPP